MKLPDKETKVNTDKHSQTLTGGIIWYGLSMFLVKGIGFISTPIFTRVLSDTQYGQFSNMMSWASIFSVFLCLSLDTAYTSARYDFDEDKDYFIYSIAVFGVFICFLGSLIVIALISPLSKLTSISSGYLILMLAYLLSIPAFNVLQTYNRFSDNKRRYTVINIAMSVLVVVISIALVFLLSNKLLGRTLGYVGVHIVVSIYCFAMILKKRGKLKLEYLKYSLKVALPLIPYSLAQYLLGSSDIVMITKICGEESTAIYSVGYTCAMLIGMFQTAIRQAWTPWFTTHLHDNEKNPCKRGVILYISFMLILAFGACLLAPEIVLIIGGKKYTGAIELIPPVVIGCVFVSMSNILCDVEIFEKKTKSMAIATMIAGVINIALNLMLIPKFGYIAAAYTTLIGYAAWFLIQYIYICKIGYKWIISKLIIIAVSVVGIVLIALSFWIYQNSIVRYILILICILMAAIMLCNKKTRTSIIYSIKDI